MNDRDTWLQARMLEPDAIAYRERCIVSEQWLNLPDDISGAFYRYVLERIRPGGFLYAVLCNNLLESVTRADAQNIGRLKDIVSFMYNVLPSGSFGSNEAVVQWLNGTQTSPISLMEQAEEDGA